MSSQCFKSTIVGLLLTMSLAATAACEEATYQSVQGKKTAVPANGAKATVLLFVSSTCPIANGYAPEINRLTKEFKPAGVEILVVHTETDLTQKAAKEHLKKFGYNCPVLLDPKRSLVKQTGATITPEAAVLSSKGELLYRGRIDDRFPDIGIQRDEPTKTELRDALKAIIADKPIAVSRTKAVGCFIE